MCDFICDIEKITLRRQGIKNSISNNVRKGESTMPQYSVDEYRAMKSSAEKRMNTAIEDRAAYRRESESCNSARRTAVNNIIAGNWKKINFERRISDIARVIRMIEELDRNIKDANRLSEETDQCYSKCIKHDGSVPAKFHDVFAEQTVRSDPDVSRAMDLLQAEKTRLENELQNLKKEIQENERQVEELTKRIAVCNAKSMECSAMIAKSWVQMDYYSRQVSNMTN